MKKMWTALCLLIVLVGCSQQKPKEDTMSSISKTTIDATIDSLKNHYPDSDATMIERGVNSAAMFWTEEDGDEGSFVNFCVNHFMATQESKEQLFNTLQTNFETLFGNYNRIEIGLKTPLHVVGAPITEMDETFGAIDPRAHFSDDMFNSKIAFSVLLNFPFYTLEEKNTLGKDWSRQEWGYARMGDLFNARVPADVTQKIGDCLTDADTYISNYNIMMGQLRNENGEQLFPNDMKLITHWGLRDELKSNYSNADGKGLEKQMMIYEIMKHIVNQSIPSQVINCSDYTWQPYSNTIYQNGVEQEVIYEPNTRYEKLFATYKAVKDADRYCPTYPTYIQRSFNQAMEVSDDEIEKMFVEFISSPAVAQTAELIKSRLGRELKPYDIWYDGFKSRSAISEDELSAKTRSLYPTPEVYEAALPGIMISLGFSPEKAAAVTSLVQVDPSRGAGHAWGALMKGDKSRLRTRIAAEGMDYKGFNIATHEFGHNVEQTITMNDVDNYMMNGVPSTAFTEALAFVFQKRDLELLGYKNDDADQEALKTLDIFWGGYEIMGVSLVDLYTWRWLYAHPDATPTQLKEAILNNAREIWNRYYAPILGEEDSPILAIYSHMIDIPLYLPNYPYGHLVEYQLEQQFAGKNIGSEIQRIYPVGRLTPNLWMEHAVGTPVSIDPLLESAKQSVILLSAEE